MRDFLLIRCDPDGGHMSALPVRAGQAQGAAQPFDRLEDVPVSLLEDANPCIMLLSGPGILVRAVDIPARNESEARAAAGFLLEDDIAAPIESQHVALAPKAPGRCRRAAVIERAAMDHIIARLEAAGIRPDFLLPEHAALAPEADKALLVDAGACILIALPAGDSFAIEPELWRLVGSGMLKEAGVARLQIISGRPQALSPDNGFGDDIDVTVADRPPEDMLIAGLLAQKPMTLLSGAYRPSGDWRARMALFRRAVALATAALLIGTATMALEARFHHREAAGARAAAQDLLLAAAPEIRRIVNPRAQMDAAIAAASARGGDFLLLSSLAFDALAARETVSVQNLRYDSNRGALDLELEFGGYDEIEAIKARLEAKGVMVREGATRSHQGRFIGTIALELGR